MKIKPEHLKVLSDSIVEGRKRYPHLTLRHYADICIGKDYRMRWRWDMFHLGMKVAPDSFKNGGRGNGLVLYDYLDDTHIDTALRFILKEELDSV
jgi:hypothetical protein